MEVYVVKEDNKVVYVGQTTGSLKDRIKGHIYTSKYAKQKYPLALAIHEKGIESFEFISIYNAKTLSELNEKEKFYIKHFNTIQNGYNVRVGGDNQYHTKETKQKISNAQLGVKNHMYGKTGELNPTSKKVINLITGDTYYSVTECAQKENQSVSKIAEVCRGVKQTLYGMVYRYIDEDGYIENIPNEKPLVKGAVYNKTRNKIYSSLSDARRDMGFAKGYLSKAISKNNEKIMGYYEINKELIKIIK